MRKISHNLGFTLVELIMVLAIVAVLCVAAAPSLRSFTKGRLLPNTATMLAATSKWCRTQAISEGMTYRLNFENDISGMGIAWWVTKDDGTGMNWVPVTTDELAEKFIVPDGVSIEYLTLKPTDEGTFLTFDSEGHTAPPGTFRVHYETNWIDVVCETTMSTYHVLPMGSTQQ